MPETQGEIVVGSQVEIQGLKSGSKRSTEAKKLRQARAEWQEGDHGVVRRLSRPLGGDKQESRP